MDKIEQLQKEKEELEKQRLLLLVEIKAGLGLMKNYVKLIEKKVDVNVSIGDMANNFIDWFKGFEGENRVLSTSKKSLFELNKAIKQKESNITFEGYKKE